MELREWYLRLRLGENCLRVEIDANKIRYETRDFAAQNTRLLFLQNPRFPKAIYPVVGRLIWELSRFKIVEESVRRVAIEGTPIYLRMKDVYENRANLKSSKTFQDIVYSIENEGFFKHKNYIVRSKEDVETCIRECYLEIMLSMKKDGYLKDKESEFATAGLGTAFVDKDGTILKGPSASHRLAAAQLVDMPGTFPIRIIGAHSDWLQAQGIHGVRDVAKISTSFRMLEASNAPE